MYSCITFYFSRESAALSFRSSRGHNFKKQTHSAMSTNGRIAMLDMQRASTRNPNVDKHDACVAEMLHWSILHVFQWASHQHPVNKSQHKFWNLENLTLSYYVVYNDISFSHLTAICALASHLHMCRCAGLLAWLLRVNEGKARKKKAEEYLFWYCETKKSYINL